MIKRLALLCCLLLLPGLAHAAYVQSNYNDGFPVTQLSVSFSNPVTAGSLLVLAIRTGNGGATAAVTSTGGQTWTLDRHVDPGLDWTFEVHSLANAPAGATTVTAQVTGGADSLRMAIVEYSGMATSSPVHQISSGSGTSGTANAGSVTTTLSSLLFVAVATDSDLEGQQAGPGYALRPLLTPVVTDKVFVEDRGPVASGTYSGTMGINSDTWAAILVAYRPLAVSTNHWVSTTGTQTTWANCASATDPGSGYCSLATANTNATAGQTVFLIAGTYDTNTERINPTNSGSAGSPITFVASGGTVVISGAACDTTGEPAINLSGKSYIVIDGITASGCAHHVFIRNGSTHNEIKNGSFNNNQNQDWNHSILDGNSQYNWIHDTQFSKGGGNTTSPADDIGTVLDIGTEGTASDQTWFNLIEDCIFFHGGHNTVSFFSSRNTIRNNYFHNEAWSAGFGNRNLSTIAGSTEAFGNTIEGNRWGYTYISIDDGIVGNVVMVSARNIFRYNSIYHSSGAGLTFAGYTGFSNGSLNRAYNNTIFHNGLDASAGTGNAVGTRFTGEAGQNPTGNALKNNLYYLNNDRPYAADSGASLGSQTIANEFTSANPLFVNASTTPPADKTDSTLPNLALQSGSPAINAGGALTTVDVADTGTGTSLLVTDATYFQDGSLAPPGTVQADWIAVGTVANIVQIASISGNTITLANSIARNDNDAIWLYKKSDGVRVLYGTAPDAGANEFGTPPSAPTGLRIQ